MREKNFACCRKSRGQSFSGRFADTGKADGFRKLRKNVLHEADRRRTHKNKQRASFSSFENFFDAFFVIFGTIKGKSRPVNGTGGFCFQFFLKPTPAGPRLHVEDRAHYFPSTSFRRRLAPFSISWSSTLRAFSSGSLAGPVYSAVTNSPVIWLPTSARRNI